MKVTSSSLQHNISLWHFILYLVINTFETVELVKDDGAVFPPSHKTLYVCVPPSEVSAEPRLELELSNPSLGVGADA